MWKVDQSVRKSKTHKKARKYIVDCKKDSTILNESKYNKSTELMNEWKTIDSLNSFLLIEKIEKNGFPSIDIVGKKTFYRLFEILVHFGYKDLENEFLPMLDKALMDSLMEPVMYSYIKDSYLFRFEYRQEYYQCFMYKDLSDLAKKKVLEKRNSIGLTKNTFKSNSIISTWE
jgi:hypothetical protein